MLMPSFYPHPAFQTSSHVISRPCTHACNAITAVSVLSAAWNAEFIEGARTGKIENAAFHAAESTLTAVMALQACVQGREMTWEDVWKAG